MQRGQSNCHASSRRHSSQAVRLKKAGATPGKDGSPMLGQKSTKLPCFGYSRYRAGKTVPLRGRERGAPSSTDCAAAQGAGSRPAHKRGSLVLGPAVSMVSIGAQATNQASQRMTASASHALPTIFVPLASRHVFRHATVAQLAGTAFLRTLFSSDAVFVWCCRVRVQRRRLMRVLM